MRRGYFSDKDFRRIRVSAVVVSLVLHSVLILGLFFYQQNLAEQTTAEEIKFGSSGGGGGEGAEDDVLQFGPQSDVAKHTGKENHYAPQLNLIQIHVYSDVENVIPIPKKEEPKPVTAKKRKPKQKLLLAENLPTRWVRRGTGPGSGGGAGGGSGGGIGTHQGYSIDWGGTGSRRLLSGRLPSYPDGTDKQMAVILQFAVLPDGSVESIIPSRKTDEHLEQAAITALRTWRFDPLPSLIDQKSQIGKVTFNFKLE